MDAAYIAIDLKSFFASVECVDRQLDPLTTNLVVADAARTEKTICLAVTPALKAHGISGRARLFEVVERVRQINATRTLSAPGGKLTGRSCFAPELEKDPSLAVDYLVAPPRMARYIEMSTKIYGIYLKYIAPEDMHIYSIDEVFIDATAYLRTYGTTARELAMRIIRDVFTQTGITATAGIGTNLYLCKIAMDIVAKHARPDKNGVRIAELDEMTYKRLLWSHRPLTDFWRVGPGYARKLEANGMYTMGDIALRSECDEEWFYRTFGINAGLLIDHAWGIEPCRISDIKSYRPASSSISSGQVLHSPYDTAHTRIIVREMTEELVLDLLEKRLVTDRICLSIGYDRTCLEDEELRKVYRGPVAIDRYGRRVPKPAQGTVPLGRQTASLRLIMAQMLALFDRIVDPRLLVRRVNVTAAGILPQSMAGTDTRPEQLDLFSDPEERQRQEEEEQAMLEREQRQQQAILSIRERYGKNAILKGTNYLDGATSRDRHRQIGGHQA